MRLMRASMPKDEPIRKHAALRPLSFSACRRSARPSDESSVPSGVSTQNHAPRGSFASICSASRARPAAICVQFCGNRVYALDGTRLACDTLEGVSFPKPFLVRADVLAHLSAFGKEDMTVRIGSSHVLFASGNLRMLARLQGVDTYNVDAVIPKGYRESVTVKTADFVRELNYLKECSALTAKPYVRFAGEQLSIAASGGAFETGIEVRGRGDMVLGFDLYHMLDALKQFKGEAEVCIHLSSPHAPIVIDAAGRSDFALVVPVRLKEEMAA